MKSTLKAYLWIGIIWGLLSALIEYALFLDCFSFGYAPSWCDFPLKVLIDLTLGFPAMIGFVVILLAPPYLFYSKTIAIIMMTIVAVIFAIVASFFLILVGRTISKLIQKFRTN